MAIKGSSLTDFERIGTNREFNLGVGHAHQRPDPAQQEIIDALPSLYANSIQKRQIDIEADFQRTFYTLAGQRSAAERRVLLCYSASQGIDLVAAHLATTGRTVGLLQPCFDALPALLRRRQVPLVPIPERDATVSAGVGALFLTLPNNPTGFTLTPVEFAELVNRCAENHIVLILDRTFQFFDRQHASDQYAVLDRSGVTFMCVEDTGKTLSIGGLKCGILASSPDVFDELSRLHSEMLLNVSPFTLSVLTACLADAGQRGLDATVWRLIRTNREALHRALHGTIVQPVRTDRTVSVEWAQVDSDEYSGFDVVELLDRAGVSILPGNHFYWDEPRLGARHVRFALARDPSVFAAAARRIADVLPKRQELEAL